MRVRDPPRTPSSPPIHSPRRLAPLAPSLPLRQHLGEPPASSVAHQQPVQEVRFVRRLHWQPVQREPSYPCARAPRSPRRRTTRTGSRSVHPPDASSMSRLASPTCTSVDVRRFAAQRHVVQRDPDLVPRRRQFCVISGDIRAIAHVRGDHEQHRPQVRLRQDRGPPARSCTRRRSIITGLVSGAPLACRRRTAPGDRSHPPGPGTPSFGERLR